MSEPTGKGLLGRRERRSRARALQLTSAVHELFRGTSAFTHDASHCREPGRHSVCVPGSAVTEERVASEWALMYHALGYDADLVEACGFEADEITPKAQMARIDELRREVRATGAFTIRHVEMQFWVRYAWMSSDRCSGRQHALQQAVIRYLPAATTADEMLQAAVSHAAIAMNAKHAPRTVVTVLGAPTQVGQVGQRFLTEQLVRFEGDGAHTDLVRWLDEQDGSLIERPRGVWAPYTVLPMVAVGSDGVIAAGTAPPSRQYLVDIPAPVHPDSEGKYDFRDRFACWTAIPAQTNFAIDVAGQRYCVIFSGWYVDEEVAIDLLDKTRYNLVPAVATTIFPIFPTGTKLDEYKVGQVEVATLRAVRAAFKRLRYRLNTGDASQAAFSKFRERYLDTYGEEPPNDPAWTANRMLSRYSRPTHEMPLVRQQRGAMLVRHQLTHRSLEAGAGIIKHLQLAE